MTQEPAGLVAWIERHQVAVYVRAMTRGAAIGLLAPRPRAGLEHAIGSVGSGVEDHGHKSPSERLLLPERTPAGTVHEDGRPATVNKTLRPSGLPGQCSRRASVPAVRAIERIAMATMIASSA